MRNWDENSVWKISGLVVAAVISLFVAPPALSADEPESGPHGQIEDTPADRRLWELSSRGLEPGTIAVILNTEGRTTRDGLQWTAGLVSERLRKEDPPAQAPQPTARSVMRVGVGVSVEPIRFNLFAELFSEVFRPVNLYIPIDIQSNFRLEPEIGIAAMSVNERTTRTLHLGLGVFRVHRASDGMILYGGTRIGANMFQERSNGYLDVSLAAVFGGEYALGSRFSLGAEGNAAARFGDGLRLYETRARFFARWYFGARDTDQGASSP